MSARPVQAQVQANFYAPYTATSTPPSPNALFTTTAPVCTTTIGGPSGFSIDFTTAAAQALLSAACGSGVAQNLAYGFGARFTGSFLAPAAGSYGLTFDSDDGNVLTINGTTTSSQWMDQGNGPGTFTALLNAGANPFVFDYYANGYGGSFARLVLPSDVTVAPPSTSTVPEPGAAVLLAAGLLGLGTVVRRRRA